MRAPGRAFFWMFDKTKVLYYNSAETEVKL